MNVQLVKVIVVRLVQEYVEWNVQVDVEENVPLIV